MFEFVALGTGTILPDPARGPAGFAVRVGDRTFLVDGGTGAMRSAARAGVDVLELAGGFYSHRHPDHCADLISVLFAMHAARQRTADYPIWAGLGFRAFFEALRAAFGGWLDPHDGRVVVHELAIDRDDVVDLGDLVVRTTPAVHGAGALHLRFEAGGRAVVFSGDTAASENLVRLAAGADLLVVECGGPDEAPIPGHLTPGAVAELVRRARPREVWLTHLYPQVDPARALATVAAAGVPVRRPDDGDVWRG